MQVPARLCAGKLINRIPFLSGNLVPASKQFTSPALCTSRRSGMKTNTERGREWIRSKFVLEYLTIKVVELVARFWNFVTFLSTTLRSRWYQDRRFHFKFGPSCRFESLRGSWSADASRLTRRLVPLALINPAIYNLRMDLFNSWLKGFRATKSIARFENSVPDEIVIYNWKLGFFKLWVKVHLKLKNSALNYIRPTSKSRQAFRISFHFSLTKLWFVV